MIVGLSASTALFLPVSTPPDAIAYSTGLIEQKDLRTRRAPGGFPGAGTDYCLGAIDRRHERMRAYDRADGVVKEGSPLTPLIPSEEILLQPNPSSRHCSLTGQSMMEFWPGWISTMGTPRAGTSGPGLAAVQEAAQSKVPTLGYGVPDAPGNILLALGGSVIVALVAPWAEYPVGASFRRSEVPVGHASVSLTTAVRGTECPPSYAMIRLSASGVPSNVKNGRWDVSYGKKKSYLPLSIRTGDVILGRKWSGSTSGSDLWKSNPATRRTLTLMRFSTAGMMPPIPPPQLTP